MDKSNSRWVVAALVVLFALHAFDRDDSKIRKLRRDLQLTSVSLTAESDGYQVIRHNLGVASIDFKSIEAHKNGSVISLDIGNLTSVAIAGAELEIGYPDPSNPGVELSFGYDISQTLEPGAATTVSLILDGVRPESFNYVRVSNFQPKGIRLRSAASAGFKQ